MGVFSNLSISISCLSLPLTPFSFSSLHWKDSVNYLHPPPLLCLSVCLSISFSPFIHLLNRASRQADLFTGVHSVLKVFKHHWMLRGGRAGGWVGVDCYMIPTLFLCKSPIANTHSVTMETLESFTLPASLHPDWGLFMPPLVWLPASISSRQLVTVKRYLCVINESVSFLFYFWETSTVYVMVSHSKAHIVISFSVIFINHFITGQRLTVFNTFTQDWCFKVLCSSISFICHFILSQRNILDMYFLF